MTTILGIDVGMSGALSFYDGEELIIYDMPVLERNKTRRVDTHKLHDILYDMASQDNIDHVYIEQVNAYGMGASSAYNFGWSCGTVEQAVASLGFPFTYVTPQKWKKAMDCPTYKGKDKKKNKDAARMRASQLLPQFAHNWPLKRHDGRAESSLIALYGFNKH